MMIEVQREQVLQRVVDHVLGDAGRGSTLLQAQHVIEGRAGHVEGAAVPRLVVPQHSRGHDAEVPGRVCRHERRTEVPEHVQETRGEGVDEPVVRRGGDRRAHVAPGRAALRACHALDGSQQQRERAQGGRQPAAFLAVEVARPEQLDEPLDGAGGDASAHARPRSKSVGIESAAAIA